MKSVKIGHENRFLSTLGIVSGGHLLSHLYLLAFPPLFPLLVEDFQLNNTQLGLIMSAVAVSMFLFQTPVGELVDRIGAKRVFVFGLLFTAAGTALVGAAQSYETLLLFAVISGIGQSAFHPADFALLNAVTEDDREGRSFGVHTFAGYAGFAIAPGLVGWLGLRFSWQTALLAVGTFGMAYAVLAQLALRPVHRRRLTSMDSGETGGGDYLESLSTLTSPAILAMFAFFVFVTMANKGVQTFTTVFLVSDFSLSEATGNAALTLYFSLAAFGVLVGGFIADRFDLRGIIIGTLTLAAVLTWLTTAPFVLLGTEVIGLFGSMGLFYGLALPSRDRLINALSSAESTGKSFGFVYTGLPLGGFIAPALLGATIDLTGFGTVAFVLIGIFYLAGALIILLLSITRDGKNQRRRWIRSLQT